jgi:hypothetical protein
MRLTNFTGRCTGDWSGRQWLLLRDRASQGLRIKECQYSLSSWELGANCMQMIPPEIKYDGHATPPQWTDNADQTIEKGTQIRLKIKGMRTDMGSLYAIGTIKEVSVS